MEKDPFAKLARILRTKPDYLRHVSDRMNALTGQMGVIEDIVSKNEAVVQQTLAGLGLAPTDSSRAVHTALVHRITHLDEQLFNMLGRPDLSKPVEAGNILRSTVRRVYTPPKGLFIKHERALQMLEKYPPQTLLEHMGYANIRELVDHEGFASVMASLRFTQTTEWMHEFFEVAYNDLGPDDFEEREVEILVLDTKWLDVAEKFLQKKYHNVSHLKEYGVIFVIPLKIDSAGETLRMFTLMLHYQHEVPFYSDIFRRYRNSPDFVDKLKSLLRGDVPAGPMPNVSDGVVWRVVQRYLAKDNADDFRLFEAHLSPEAEHWLRAEEDLGRLSRILGKEDGELNIGWWRGLDYIGDYFPDAGGGESLVSFDLIDLLMALVIRDRPKYLYHHQEALWNRIFMEYMGRERMNDLIVDHIFDGFVKLE